MKNELRYKYKIKRKHFQFARREVADGAILDAFMLAHGTMEKYFIYNSFATEADTHSIIDALLSCGKQVFLPKTVGKDMFAVRYLGGELEKGEFGIFEPKGEPYEGDFDVVVVPLLAINERGYRLGYGGGYYDRFLKDKKCLKVGIGYGFQLTDEFIEDEWDEPLDEFISEKGMYYFGKSNE